MKFKKFFSMFLATIMLITALPSSAYADDVPTDYEESFEIIWYNDDESIVTPRINADGTFTYYFSDRLHSSTFTATSDKISLSFITSTNTNIDDAIIGPPCHVSLTPTEAVNAFAITFK